MGLAKKIPNSEQGRREQLHRERKRAQLGKMSVLGLGLLTLGLTVYAFAQGA